MRALALLSNAEVRLALCQVNATVGDITGNAERIRAGIDAARAAGAELVLFGELALTGYPPEDLLLKEHFLRDARTALDELATHAEGIVAVVGYPERAEDVFNAAAVLSGGVVAASYRKLLLPNYGVFDEQRYFRSGPSAGVIDVGQQRVGLTICEDIWEPGPPASEAALAGATLILNISASPYHAGKGAERELMLAQRARENVACVAFCALIGGQDELVFDGHSCVIDHTGRTLARARQFEEELLLCDLDLSAASAARLRDARSRPAARRSDSRVQVLAQLPAARADEAPPAAPLAPAAAAPAGTDSAAAADWPAVRAGLAELLTPEEAEVYAALSLGLRDYVQKNGFRHVVLGLSGGIDSALVVCLAADALGPEQVSVAIMPSRYSSAETQDDARALAARLAVQVHELPIEAAMRAYSDTLSADFAGHEPGLAEENLQARIRGNLLMALSNKFGWLVLTTGNKSEMSVGYSTLYGDLAGGLAVIKDVPKTLVYRLARWRNSPAGASAGVAAASAGPERVDAPIPQSIIERAPSAELRPDQRDEDSLPAYRVLDGILRANVELDHGREQLLAAGFPADAVEQTLRLVDLAEYKRRQAPPGIKVTTRAFGRDRRMPITNRYRG
ncbi:MAG TPA: NAD+ synthase [Solirubrobacteraceae bacterium]|nr:NAD+ synthase [Solirubrobacteraceae bacterium]